jgi:hypothetical protein
VSDPSHLIDREKLAVRLRRVDRSELFIAIERALSLIPVEQLGQLLVRPRRVDEVLSDGEAPGCLVEAVRKFDQESRRHKYYEPFDVNWKNSNDVCKATEAWFAECERLFRACTKWAARGFHDEARAAFEAMFALVGRMNDGEDIVFFADEGGSYMLSVSWPGLLAAYSSCLAEVEPEDFVGTVGGLIGEYAGYRSTECWAAVRAVASPAQLALCKQT